MKPQRHNARAGIAEPIAMGNKPRRVIDGHTVEERTGYSRVHRWRLIRKNAFPAPIVLGANKIGWYEDEIEAWLASRPRRTYGSTA